MARRQSSPDDEATSSSEGADSLQPFFVLHEARPEAERVPRSGKGSKKRGAGSSPKSPEKFRRMAPSDEQISEALRQHWCLKAFNHAWSKIHSDIQGVLRDINLKLFNEVLQWVEECFSEIKSSVKLSPSEMQQPYPLVNDTFCRKIPTAFVLTKNAEFVDDIQTFCDLGSHLKSNGCHVASLSALDFSLKNGIGGSIRSLLRQLHTEPLDEKIADMLKLAKWYCEGENYANPIVVMIDDMERCNACVLGNLINMLSEWVIKIPIFFIMGVATTIEAPKNLLPSDALQHLDPCKLTLGTPSDRMNSLIESVLVPLCYCFSLSHKVTLFLRNYFLRHDGTITSFISALKLACSKHFSEETASFLYLYMLEKDEDYKEYQCDNFASLPKSMKEWILDLHSCKSERDLQDDVSSIMQKLSDLRSSRRDWTAVVLCLFEVAKYSKIQLLDILCEATDPEMCKSCSDSNSKETSKFGGKNPCERLSSAVGSIARAIHTIREMPVPVLTNLLNSWNDHTEKLTEINGEVKKLQSQLTSVTEGKVYEENLPNIRKRYASLLSGKGNTANEKVAMLLDAMIRKYMRPTECMALHEIICFGNVDVLRSGLIGDPRKMIQLDLLKCHDYLACSCCSSEAKSLSPSMHDTSIMYKLAQEYGDVINLYEWYQSFKNVLTSAAQTPNKKRRLSSASKKTKTSPPPENEAQIQARFCGAVTELQMTGLLRMPSKRRPDFVQRIAFGL